MNTLRIGDFSQLAQVSTRTLRLYDELGLIAPVQIDKFTKYRYYSIEQLPRLNRILALKDLGFSLEQISRLLEDDLSAEQLRGMLAMKHVELKHALLEGQAQLMRVEARLKQIESEGKVSSYEIVLKNVEPITIASVRQIIPTINDMVAIRCNVYTSLYNWLAEQKIDAEGQEFAIYSNDEYIEENIEMEGAVAVEKSAIEQIAKRIKYKEKIVIRELPSVPLMASTIHQGRFMEVGNAITAVFMWAVQNNYEANGAYREVHLFGREKDLQDANNVTVEIQLPIIQP